MEIEGDNFQIERGTIFSNANRNKQTKVYSWTGCKQYMPLQELYVIREGSSGLISNRNINSS